MKIAVIGATGFVGNAIVNEAVSRNIDVLAIARHPDKLEKNPHVKAIQVDIMETEKLASIIKDSEVVVSAYNAGWTNPNLYNEFLKGSESIQKAVKESGVKRYIVCGGAGSLFVGNNVQLVDTPQFPKAFKPGALAARDYLNSLKKETDLDWTFISPAIEMNPETEHKRTGNYSTGKDSPVFDAKGRSVISVEDLAVAIINEVQHPEHFRERFTVAY